MTNLALAPDVKCYHAQAAIEKMQARKFGLSCDNGSRNSKLSQASALVWLNENDEFDLLVEKAQNRVKCAARDLERVITLNPSTCPSPIEVEQCDSNVACGVLTIADVEEEECFEGDFDGPIATVSQGFQIAPPEPQSLDLYELGILDKTDRRYYSKSEIDRMIANMIQATTHTVNSSAFSVPQTPLNPRVIPTNLRVGDMVIETYSDAILFWRYDGISWTVELRYDYPKDTSTRVITSSASALPTDDLVIANAGTNSIVYSLDPSPEDNQTVSIIGYNLTNGVKVSGNGNTINEASGDVDIFNPFQAYRFRWSEDLNTWIIV